MERLPFRVNLTLRKVKYGMKLNNKDKINLNHLDQAKYIGGTIANPYITTSGLSYLATIWHEFIIQTFSLGISLLSLAISAILLLKDMNLLKWQ